jgi:SAM-dependent methyltransferase
MPYFDMYKEGTTSVTGVDWESTHGENKYADKVADLNEGIPFEESSFDSILCTDVIAHIFEPKNLFGDFSRVLRKDGYLVLTCPFFYWISEPPYEFYRYTEYAFRRFCEEAGLEVIHLQPYGGRKDIFLDLLNKKMTGKISNRIFSLLARIVGASSTNKYLETDTSRKFPLGYTLVAKKTVD